MIRKAGQTDNHICIREGARVGAYQPPIQIKVFMSHIIPTITLIKDDCSLHIYLNEPAIKRNPNVFIIPNRWKLNLELSFTLQSISADVIEKNRIIKKYNTQ